MSRCSKKRLPPAGGAPPAFMLYYQQEPVDDVIAGERSRTTAAFPRGHPAEEGPMARPVVNEDLCVGCRLCESVCPQVFAVNSDEKSEVIGPDKCGTCDCQQAIDGCPAQAISWED